MCSRLQRADAERGNAGTCWKRDAGIPMISTSRKYVASLETHVASCSKSRNICCESQICNIRPQLSKLIFGFISNCLLFFTLFIYMCCMCFFISNSYKCFLWCFCSFQILTIIWGYMSMIFIYWSRYVDERTCKRRNTECS